MKLNPNILNESWLLGFCCCKKNITNTKNLFLFLWFLLLFDFHISLILILFSGSNSHCFRELVFDHRSLRIKSNFFTIFITCIDPVCGPVTCVCRERERENKHMSSHINFIVSILKQSLFS